MIEMKEIPERLFVISGGTAGIGREAVRAFLELNVGHVVYTGRNMEKLGEAQDEFDSISPGAAHAVHLDHGLVGSSGRLLHEVASYAHDYSNKRVDGLFLNAGMVHPATEHGRQMQDAELRDKVFLAERMATLMPPGTRIVDGNTTFTPMIRDGLSQFIPELYKYYAHSKDEESREFWRIARENPNLDAYEIQSAAVSGTEARLKMGMTNAEAAEDLKNSAAHMPKGRPVEARVVGGVAARLVGGITACRKKIIQIGNAEKSISQILTEAA